MKTEYALSKHRYYELKHFCLQYPDWIKEYRDADGWSGKGDTTSRDGIKRAEIIRFVDLIQTCAYDTNRDLHFIAACKRANVEPCRFHDLRHFAASEAHSLGVPDKYIVERMGHATDNMLKTVYEHAMKDKVDKFAEAIDEHMAKLYNSKSETVSK